MKKANIKTAGRCLCGEVTFAIDGYATYQLTCYCRDCQYLCGGAPNTSFTISASELTVLTGELKEYVGVAESGSRVTRCFCSHCGTVVLGKSSRWPGDVSIRVGCLEDSTFFVSEMNVWVSSAQPWHIVDSEQVTYQKGPA